MQDAPTVQAQIKYKRPQRHRPLRRTLLKCGFPASAVSNSTEPKWRVAFVTHQRRQLFRAAATAIREHQTNVNLYAHLLMVVRLFAHIRFDRTGMSR